MTGMHGPRLDKALPDPRDRAGASQNRTSRSSLRDESAGSPLVAAPRTLRVLGVHNRPWGSCADPDGNGSTKHLGVVLRKATPASLCARQIVPIEIRLHDPARAVTHVHQVPDLMCHYIRERRRNRDRSAQQTPRPDDRTPKR